MKVSENVLMILKRKSAGQLKENCPKNIPKRSKVELIVHPILPAIVHVRGNTTTSLTTPCVVEGYAVKSSTYRMVESG